MKQRVQFHSKLYIGNSIEERKVKRIKRMIEKKPLICKEYIISIAGNDSDQLNIYAVKYLFQKYYLTHPPLVVGIAANYEEAVELVQNIVRDCLNSRGDAALKEYLLC